MSQDAAKRGEEIVSAWDAEGVYFWLGLPDRELLVSRVAAAVAEAVKERDRLCPHAHRHAGVVEELERKLAEARREERAYWMPFVQSAMLWFKEHGRPELSWQYEAALTVGPPARAPEGTKENT